MASVRICPTCGEKNLVRETFCCRCRTPLGGVDPIDDLAQEATAAGVAGPDGDTVAEQRRPTVTTREGQAPGAADASPGRRIAAVLEFSWGAVRVGESLALGRDEDFSSMAAQLASNDYVSRRHAEVWVEEGDLFVRDLDSTNGTYVNDERLSPDVPALLNDGDRLGLSRRLTAIVRIERDD